MSTTIYAHSDLAIMSTFLIMRLIVPPVCARRRPAPARPPRAPASRMPTSAAQPNVTQATSAHARSSAARITTCVRTTLSRALHMHALGSRTSANPTNAPVVCQLSAHAHAQRRAQPALSLLGTQQKCKSPRRTAATGPGPSRASSCRTVRPAATATNVRRADVSRSAAARVPAPAAAAAAPAQRSLAQRAARQTRSTKLALRATFPNPPRSMADGR